MTTGYRYPMRKCPYCGKYYANVKNHIAMKHAQGSAELTAADLLGESKRTPPEPEPEPSYFCTSCQAHVRRGEWECWQCGAELKWDSV